MTDRVSNQDFVALIEEAYKSIRQQRMDHVG
jgi:hypothetical protein